MSDDLKIRMPEWARNMYNRLVALINAGGGGGGEENVIESISMNGVNVPPDANKNVALAESDPTVPSWAKAATKPSYTAQEVGALPASTTYVSGVKGNAESTYRTGQVNLTPANIGAVARSGDTMTGPLTVPKIYSTNAAYPAYTFTNEQNAQVADIYYDIGSKVFVFRYDPNGQEEHYVLPTATGSGGHYILTDKSTVLVTQGGTGATTAAGARTNIGYGCPSGSFVAADGKTITVTNGFITNIS